MGDRLRYARCRGPPLRLQSAISAAVTTITRTITVAAGVFGPGHLGELSWQVPFGLVDAVLAETGARERRLRDLPSRAGVYFVLALGLFPLLGRQRGQPGHQIPDPWLGCGQAGDLCGPAQPGQQHPAVRHAEPAVTEAPAGIIGPRELTGLRNPQHRRRDRAWPVIGGAARQSIDDDLMLARVYQAHVSG